MLAIKRGRAVGAAQREYAIWAAGMLVNPVSEVVYLAVYCCPTTSFAVVFGYVRESVAGRNTSGLNSRRSFDCA